MSTLVITRRLGDAIRRLKNGWWLAKTKRGRYSFPRYWWVTDQSAEALEDGEKLVNTLQKLKLVGDRAFSPYSDRNRYFVHGTRRLYEATQYCLEFRLPSEEFWISDEPPSS